MKYISILLLILPLSMTSLLGQDKSPVTWGFELVKLHDDQYEVKATATMKKSWVLYSQFTDDAGPIPTEFEVDGALVSFEEKSKAIKEFDEMFEVTVIKFKESAVFTQTINKGNSTSLQGSVTYMTCDGARCLPPVTVDFDLTY